MRSRRGPHAPIGHNAPKVKRILPFIGTLPPVLLRINLYLLRIMIMCRVWRSRWIPGCPWCRKSVLNLDSYQRKTTDWSTGRRSVSCIANTRFASLSLSIAATCSFVPFNLFISLGCYNYLYRMKALDAIRDAGNWLVHINNVTWLFSCTKATKWYNLRLCCLIISCCFFVQIGHYYGSFSSPVFCSLPSHRHSSPGH